MTPDEEKIIAAIPAEFHMISGSADVQTSADVFNVNKVPFCSIGREFTCIPPFCVTHEVSIIEFSYDYYSSNCRIPPAKRVAPAPVRCCKSCIATSTPRPPCPGSNAYGKCGPNSRKWATIKFPSSRPPVSLMSISPCTYVLRDRRDESEPCSLVSIIPDSKDNWYVCTLYFVCNCLFCQDSHEVFLSF
jgi:hypothetical protein